MYRSAAKSSWLENLEIDIKKEQPGPRGVNTIKIRSAHHFDVTVTMVEEFHMDDLSDHINATSCNQQPEAS